jgi:hypothetical protein
MKPTKARRGSRASKPTGKATRQTTWETAVVEDARGPRKLIEFDAATLQALELLGRDSMKDIQELADEAFRDLLKKHGRPASLKEALRQSTRQMPANDAASAPAKRRRK